MRISVLSLLLAAFCFSGCINFVKPEPLAGQIEDSMKTRWVAKRMAELQATGTATDPREARRIAVEEFKKKYEYTSAAAKPDPVSSTTP